MRTGLHIGYLHLIFRGGIVLLLFFLVGPIFLGIKTLLSEHRNITFAAAGVLVQYMVDLAHLGFPEAKLWFVLICLSMGICASSLNTEIQRETHRWQMHIAEEHIQ